METIGKRLQRFRKEKQLSQKEIAESISVPVTTYRDWEYGSLIKGEPYFKLAETFGVSLYELLGGEPIKIRKDLLLKLKLLKKQIEDVEKDMLSLF
jgi:transcriptional regulator with XRE-family HTH domain